MKRGFDNRFRWFIDDDKAGSSPGNNIFSSEPDWVLDSIRHVNSSRLRKRLQISANLVRVGAIGTTGYINQFGLTYTVDKIFPYEESLYKRVNRRRSRSRSKGKLRVSIAIASRGTFRSLLVIHPHGPPTGNGVRLALPRLVSD